MTFNDLSDQIDTEIKKLDGQVSLKVKFLESLEVYKHNIDQEFWAASVIKVPIACEFFRQVKEGKLDLETKIQITSENYVDASGVIKHLSRDISFTYKDLVTLMLIVSDNSATNQVVDIIGWESVEKYMKDLGLEHTTFRHKMTIKAGRGPNLTTADDMTLLLEKLYNNELSGSQEIIHLMTEQLDRTKIPLYIPNDIDVAHKYGALEAATHEIGIVYSMSPFTYVFLSDDQSDKTITNHVLAKCAKYCFDYSQQ